MEKLMWGDYSYHPKEEVGLFEFIGQAFPFMYTIRMVNEKIRTPIDDKIKFRCSKVKDIK